MKSAPPVRPLLRPAGPRAAAGLRRRAEQSLTARHTEAGKARIETDAQHLVHELQVHQVELQMQNAELQEARERTETLLEKYTDLYDFAPVGYFSLTADGRIRLVNLTGARLVGLECARLLGRPLESHLGAAGRPAFRTFLQRVFAGDARQACEVPFAVPGRPARIVRLEAARSPDKTECRVAATDVTERKQAEETVSRNEALLAALVEQAPVGVYVVDGRSRLQQINPRALPVFRNVRPLVGRDFSEVVHLLWSEKVAGGVMERFRHTLKTGRTFHSADFTERRRDTGMKESYEWQFQRIVLPAGDHGVVCFFNDITARKLAEATQRRVEALAAANEEAHREIARRALVETTLRKSEQTQREMLAESRELHAQMRHLTRQILLTQEEERKIISRELHDEVAQILAGINVQLATLTEAASIRPRELRKRIVKTQRMVEQSVRVVHRYARELRPAMLDDLGLIPALRSYIRDLPARKGLRIRFSAFAGVEALENSRRTVLYRVAQESLTNVIRHAHARHATVRIRRLRDAVSLVVRDDGKSFPAERLLASNTSKRLGLLGMRERVEMVGGKFSIESTPGRGTSVRAELPFRESPNPTKS